MSKSTRSTQPLLTLFGDLELDLDFEAGADLFKFGGNMGGFDFGHSNMRNVVVSREVSQGYPMEAEQICVISVCIRNVKCTVKSTTP